MGIFERKTAISDGVLEIIQAHHGPISSAQLTEALQQKGITPNPSTVYRILEKLKSKEVIKDVVFKNGVTYYERVGRHHHHHFICTVCDHITCLEGCHVASQNIDLSALLPSPAFKINEHEFTLYGSCNTCTQRTQSEKVTTC